MKMINTADVAIMAKLGAGYTKPIQPGEIVEIEDKFVEPVINSNGSRGLSTIEAVCPHLKPASPEDHIKWMQTPAYKSHTKETVIPSMESLLAMGIAPAVAKNMIKQALVSAQEALEVYEEVAIKQVKDIAKKQKANREGLE